MKPYNKKEIYCSNCGSANHYFKECSDPITSYGIILIKFDIDQTINNFIIRKFEEMHDQDVHDIINGSNNANGIDIKEYTDIELFSKLKNSIKFLMIQRKHTLGFMEFIRGRYNIDNVDGIIFLFQQMTPIEIKKIKENTFDELWNDIWGNDNKMKPSYQNEYTISKDKFNKLQNENNGQLGLSFYVNNVTSNWEFAEWGFPKGRRNIKEENISCAIREFQEESNYPDDDFIILKNIKPLEENLVGTNGINYKHIYYIALATTNKSPSIDADNNEIGDINFFTYDDAISIIRQYHVEKQKILTQLYIYIINTLIEYIKMIRMS